MTSLVVQGESVVMSVECAFWTLLIEESSIVESYFGAFTPLTILQKGLTGIIRERSRLSSQY